MPFLDDIALEGAGASLGLLPGDAVEHDFGVGQVGAQVHALLVLRIARDRDLGGELTLHDIVDVEAELRAIVGIEAGVEREGRLLVQRHAKHMLPVGLDRHALDQHVAARLHGRTCQLQDDIGTVDVVGRKDLRQAPIADARLAVNFQIGRCHDVLQGKRQRKLGLEFAIDRRRVEPAVLQNIEGFLRQHLQGQ